MVPSGRLIAKFTKAVNKLPMATAINQKLKTKDLRALGAWVYENSKEEIETNISAAVKIT